MEATQFDRKSRSRPRSLIRLPYQDVIVYLWAILLPWPYDLAVGTMIVLPWVALILLYRERGNRSGLEYAQAVRADDSSEAVARALASGGVSVQRLIRVSLLLLAPGGILLFRAFEDVHLLHLSTAIAPAIAGTILMCCAGVLALRGKVRPWWAAVIVLPVLFAPYGCGASVLLNSRLDRASPQTFTATVVDKRPGGKGALSVTLSRWGPVSGTTRLSADSDFYNSVEVGGTVCVRLHPGLFSGPWFVVEHCSTAQ